MTNRDTYFAAKTKNPLENILFVQNKNIIIKILIFCRGWCVYMCQNLDFRGVFWIFSTKKVLNRDICFAAKTKNTLMKGYFGQNKDITPKIYGILKEWCVQILENLTLKGCFWFWQYFVYFVTDWLFQVWDFFVDIFSPILP